MAAKTIRPDSDACVVRNFDRVSVWIDHDALPVAVESITCDGATIEVHAKPMPYNSRWKLRLDILQPSVRCLRQIQGALGAQIGVQISYAEFALDVKVARKREARAILDSFLNTARMRSQRQTVIRFEQTWYFGRRAASGRGKVASVLVAYADKPSKLHDPNGTSELPSCFHVEWRAQGQKNLAKLGVATLSDLIDFDHERFWDRQVRIFRLPAKKYALGTLVRALSGRTGIVSNAALRKRAETWARRYSIPVDDRGSVSVFVMHNAIIATPMLHRALEKMTFSEWLMDVLRSLETT